MADCNYNLRLAPGFSSVLPLKKKSFKSGQVYGIDAQLAEIDEK